MKPTDQSSADNNHSPGSWEGNREEQLRSWPKATPAQRLAWLEEALQLAWKVGAIKPRL